jgi:hypothetical protein
MPPALGDIGVFRQLQDLTRRLNSLTKYPSIPTYHSLDAKGKITEQVEEDLAQENVVATEKVDGTNARILLVGADKWSAPQLYIGSRADLLFRAGDGLWRDDNQIVEALLPRVVKWSDALHFPGLTVLYGEVYGGKINGWKNYTGAGALGFRLFDAWRMSHDQVDDRLGAEPAALAQWRDAGGQPFIGWGDLCCLAARLGQEVVPKVGADRPWPEPHSIEDTYAWAQAALAGRTRAALDDGAAGTPEGVVLRDASSGRKYKIVLRDYERRLR